jgi:hypothetical protein
MRWCFLITGILMTGFIGAQNKSGSKELGKPMVIFKIRPKSITGRRSDVLNRPQNVTLNEIFNQYRLTHKPHKEDPPNIKELLDYRVDRFVLSWVEKNIIKEDNSGGLWGYTILRTLDPGQKAFFEKVQLRGPDGRFYYVKKIRAVKR